MTSAVGRRAAAVAVGADGGATSAISVSAIVPCRNAAATLAATLKSLCDSTTPPCEIVWVDDHSTDGSFDLVGDLARRCAVPVRRVRARVARGAAAARNLGASLASGDYVLFVDADVVLERDTIERLLREARVTRCGIVVARLRDRSLQPGVLAHFQAHLVHTMQATLDPADAPSMGTHCALLRAQLFRASGGFDERYHGATVEDFELGHRLRAAGHRIHIAPDAHASHNHRYDVSSFARNYYAKARDLTGLVMRSRDARRTSGGYFAWSSLAALLLVALAVGSGLAAVLDRSLRWLAGACVLGIAVLWRRYVARVARGYGPATAARFLALRVAVTVLGGLGIAVALLAMIRARAADALRRRRATWPVGDPSSGGT